MARPDKHTVDYFPFYVKDGKTLFILESKYGCKGTGFFTNVMRFLCSTPDHHYCIKDEADRMYFFSRCHCDEVSGLDMLNIMAKSGKIYSSLWVSRHVIVSKDLLDSLRDAYAQRKIKLITIDELMVIYPDNTPQDELSAPEIHKEGVVSGADKPQIKEKKIKEKKSICKSPLPSDFKISDRVKKWAAEKKYSNLNEHLENFKLQCTAKGYTYVDWDSAFMNAIRNDWARTKGNGNHKPYVSSSGERDVRDYEPEDVPIETEEQRQANLKKIREFTSGIGGRASP